MHVLLRLHDPDVFKGDAEFAKEVMEKGYGILGGKSPAPTGLSLSPHSEDEITAALRSLGKTRPEDELNCGGCG
jgi:hypothetical protein